MRILVTGGAGFIGLNLINHLAAARAHQLTIVDNLSVGLPSPRLPDGVEFIEAEYSDRAILAPLLRGVDAVVHLAALSGVIDSINNPAASFETNVLGSYRLLEAAREARVKKFICASTGGALLGDVTPPISETMAPSPLSPYGASKLALEGYCSAFAASYGMNCIVLRFSNVYGPYSAHKKSAVAAFVKSILAGTPVTIYGDGSQQRDFLFVGDLVEGIRTALDQPVSGVFQLGFGYPTTINELVRLLEVLSGKRLMRYFKPPRLGEVHSTWCDIAKARHALGFSADTTLEKGLRATIEWFKTNESSALAQAAVSED